MLQCKTVIKGIFPQAFVSFVTPSTAASTKGNDFLYWKLDFRTDSF